MSISQNFPNTRPSLSINFARSQTLDPRITFTRTTSGTRVGPDGYIEVIPADQPRFDFDPVTGECLGLLIEEQRENLITYSGEFNDNYGIKTNTTVSLNDTIAPDGTVSADKIVGNSGQTALDIRTTLISFTSGNIYTYSVFVKKSEWNIVRLQFNGNIWENVELNQRPAIQVDLNTGEVTSSILNSGYSVTKYPNDYYRLTLTAECVVSANSVIEIQLTPNGVGDGTSGIYIWGAQLEQGSFPTSYIPKSGLTVTRTADNASITGSNFTEWYNPSEGTIVLSAISRMPDTHTFNRSFAIFGDGTYTYQTGFYKRVGIAIMRPVISNVELTGTTLTKDLSFKAALSMSSSLNQFCYNGSFISSSSTPIPSQIDRIHFYDITGAGIGHPTATISSFQYYPTRLPNAQLQTLTK